MPFKILTVADFSGKARVPGRVSPPVPVDLDNFEDVLAAIAPAAEIDGKRIIFRELGDFHPDQLFRGLSVVRRDSPPAAPVATQPAAGRTSRPGIAPRQPRASILDDILDEGEQTNAPVTVEDAGDLNAFIQRVTAGHTTAAEDPQKAEQEAALGEKMRNILHDGAFQSLESAWRGLRFLLSGTDKTCRMYLLDATLPELVKNLDQLQPALKRLGPWGLIVGDFYFGQSDTEAAVLERLGKFAQSLGATLLSGALVPEDSGGEGWNQLRRIAVARSIGLVLPRFLLRLPYGKQSSSVDALDFEEMADHEHGRYLWGNGAHAAAFLIGAAYDEENSSWKRHVARRIDGLPLHVYREGTEHVSLPCAEVLMSEEQAEMLLNLGYMPLASLKDQDGVILVQFRSIASPAAPLAALV